MADQVALAAEAARQVEAISPSALGGGAQFVAYLSIGTPKYVTSWKITLTQGEWTGTLSSSDPLPHVLKTNGMSGVFDVTVFAEGPSLPSGNLQPFSWSKPNIGCNANCSSMIGIAAGVDGTTASYWTTWDAVCNSAK